MAEGPTLPSASRPWRIALLAGEVSSDALGAALIGALKVRCPGASFFGVTGPAMRAAGCESLGDIEELSVFGITEVIHHLPRLLKLRRRVLGEILERAPDVFVGIDSPGFNLGMARLIRPHGVRTVQYVSPSVWAWRQRRVHYIRRHCDLVLCVLPFEPDFYRDFGVRAEFVGHPLADQIPLHSERAAARARLGIGADECVVALLPGSRMGEIERLAPVFFRSAQWLAARHPGLRFLAPMASSRVRARVEQFAPAGSGGPGAVRLLDGQARDALASADAALIASGTATLEALLCGCPMVVAYRLGAVTVWLARLLRLVRVRFFSLPNLLAGEAVVAELFQEQVSAEALGAAVLELLDSPVRRAAQAARFAALHATLRQDGAARAADAICRLLQAPPAPRA